MPVRTVRLLHVEDDVIQLRMVAHHLKAIPEFAFAITAAASEELAMECFQSAKPDLVLLDYQLAQGDGMHLLVRMRELDPIMPIIAISGMATSEIAAELVKGGADDYFTKRDLKSADLAKSIRSSLRRAEAVRRRIASRTQDKLSGLTNQLTELCADYVRRMSAEFLEQLDVVAQGMKSAHISAPELQRMHEMATSQLEVPIGLDQEQTKLLARALLFELLVRVYDYPDLSAVRPS
jgi:DNA-binding response OmpR family regulator